MATAKKTSKKTAKKAPAKSPLTKKAKTAMKAVVEAIVAADAKRPIGRPSKYDPAFCEQVIALGKQGMGKAEIAEELDVNRDTLYAWEKEHPDFSGALSRAMQASQAWWERTARSGICMPTSNFNAALFGKVMSARFPTDWRETTNVNHGGQGADNPVVVAPSTKHLTEVIGSLIAANAKADEITAATAGR